MDHYFTSVDLLDELHIRGFQGTGTMQKLRVPNDAPFYTDAELRGGGRGYYCKAVREDGQVCILKWFDNKSVVLSLNMHGSVPTDICCRWYHKEKMYIDVSRPNIIKKYNIAVGGVYLLDCIISYYRFIAKTKKRTQ